jgi:hypothetical protein
MLKRLLIFLIIFLFQCHTALMAQVYSITSGSVSFHSDAPLELISASSNELRGKIDIEKKNFAFMVKMASFSGFNNPLQKEHFNENYLESTLYPNASFTGKIIEDLDLSVDGSFTIRAKGNFTVHGISQERIIKSDVTVKNGIISIRSSFTVMLADHNISIPKVVHEKLASEIKVEIKADLAVK